MKTKMTKKVFAVLIAMTLVFGMALTALAATGTPDNGSLTVTGDKEFVGKTVSAYQVFTANWADTNETDANDDNIDLSDNISYVLNSDWEGFFTETNLDGTNGLPALSTIATYASPSDRAAQYIDKLTKNENAQFADALVLKLAKEMKAYAKANHIAATYTSEAATMPAGATVASVTIGNMTPGYYLVIPQSGSTSTDRETDATLVNVPSAASASWAIKSSYPTVEKTVDGNAMSTAKIGDTVNFTLNSTVPDMTEYDTYYFAFHDTLSKGLTYDATTGVAVTIDGDTIDSSKYTVTYIPDTTNNNNSGQLNVVFNNLKAAEYVAKEGKAIVVTYSAMLNENAVIASTGNKNEATVEYTNGPSTDDKGTSTPSETKTYTYQITIDKHDDSGVKLAGAVFKLKDSSDDVIRLIPTGTANEYRVANPTEIAETTNNQTVETVTTPAVTGLVVIKGLEAGTYKLEEVTAPTGYNKLADDTVIVITAAADGTPTYTVNSGAQGNSETVNVVNTKGAMLPITGGIGTIGLTVLGVGVVIFGFVFTSKKKKKAE